MRDDASATYKNGGDLWKSLRQDKQLVFTPPEPDKNAMATQKEMWRIHANNTIKREELLEAIMEALYAIL